jgi:hypothetical protein
MTFLYPQFLFGLLALAIPVIIHLFDFRKTKKVYFSNTRFLLQVKDATNSRYKLKHFLILVSRLLFILFLVFAFAQPFIPAQNGRGLVANKVGIYIDNSLSMSNEVASELSGLDLAKEIATELIALYPSETEFKVLSTAQLIAPRQLKSRQEAVRYISELRYADNYKTIDQILRLMLDDDDHLREIYLISDFQQSTTGTIGSKIDSLTKAFLIPIRYPEHKNVYIDSLFIDNPFLLGNDKVVLKVGLKNISRGPIENLPIKLFLNNRQISATTIAIAPFDVFEVEFDLGYNLDNFNNGYVKIEDYPVAFDNEFYFTLNIGNKINVLEIAGADAGNFISGVYGNTNLFTLTTLKPGNIDYSLLQTSDLIIVNQLNALSDDLSNRLIAFHASGGTILIVPGPSPETTTFSKLISGVRTIEPGEFERLLTPDFTRPFFNNILLPGEQDISMPKARPVWYWGADRSAFLKLQDGRPFLSEVSANKFVLASPLHSEFSLFQTHAIFVPIMYRVAAKSGFKDQPLFYRLSETELAFRIDSLRHNELIKIAGEVGEIIPDQRISGRILQISISEGLLPAGHYDLIAGGIKRFSFALNNEKKESDLLQLSDNELVTGFSALDAQVYSTSDSDSVIQQLSTKYKGNSLWRYALSLSLLFLLVEVLLIRIL